MEQREILFDKLPGGIKRELEMNLQAYGEYMPSMAVRHWIEIPEGHGSKSQWCVDGYAISRQAAGAIGESLYLRDHFIREVWNMRDGIHHPGPDIIDFCHSDYGSTFPHTLPKAARAETIEEIASASLLWVMAYYRIDPSNTQYVQVQDTHIRPRMESHLAECKVTFSETGEQVKLCWRLGREPFVYGLRYPGQNEF